MVNPYVFIVGGTRSGTTLLQRMVDAHPDLAVIHETHWIPRFYEERIGLTPGGMVTTELVAKLLDDRRFGKLGIAREDLEGLIPRDGPISYADYVTRIFDLYGEARGKRSVGEKTPSYVRNLPTLHRLWPTARFVHLIRDGRDVFLSMINWKRANRAVGRFAAWTRDPVSASAFWWKWHVRLGREAAAGLGQDLYREVRYEALVADPAGECTKLCTFLGLPYADTMLEFHEGRTKTKPGLDAKRAWLPITRGLRDWRSEMRTEDLERFEAAAGDLLDELGYERAFLNPGPQVLEHATELRDSLAQEMQSQTGYPLPKHL
jgi:Sulfotransferase family